MAESPRAFWNVTFLQKPLEPSWNSSPWFFPSGSLALDEVLLAIREKFLEDRVRKPSYNFIMDIVLWAIF